MQNWIGVEKWLLLYYWLEATDSQHGPRVAANFTGHRGRGDDFTLSHWSAELLSDEWRKWADEKGEFSLFVWAEIWLIKLFF
jgi:hypothetical protein